MREERKGNKAIQKISNMLFYGQYYNNEFQVLNSAVFTERRFNNWIKKYL
jgi:hypothetical protein